MKKLTSSLCCCLILCLSACNSTPTTSPPPQKVSIPLTIQENKGQVDEQVRYLIRSKDQSTFFTDDEIVYRLEKDELSYALRLSFPESNTNTPEAEEALEGTINYMIGNDESKWQQDIKTFESIRYPELYQGIDLVIGSLNTQALQTYEVSTEAKSSDISWQFEGVEKLELNPSGDLLVHLSAGFPTLLYKKPQSGREFFYEILSENTVRLTTENETSSDPTEISIRGPLTIDK